MPIYPIRRLEVPARTRKVKRGESYIIRLFESPRVESGAVGKIIAVDSGLTYQFTDAGDLWRFLTEAQADGSSDQE